MTSAASESFAAIAAADAAPAPVCERAAPRRRPALSLAGVRRAPHFVPGVGRCTWLQPLSQGQAASRAGVAALSLAALGVAAMTCAVPTRDKGGLGPSVGRREASRHRGGRRVSVARTAASALAYVGAARAAPVPRLDTGLGPAWRALVWVSDGRGGACGEGRSWRPAGQPQAAPKIAASSPLETLSVHGPSSGGSQVARVQDGDTKLELGGGDRSWWLRSSGTW